MSVPTSTSEETRARGEKEEWSLTSGTEHGFHLFETLVHASWRQGCRAHNLIHVVLHGAVHGAQIAVHKATIAHHLSRLTVCDVETKCEEIGHTSIHHSAEFEIGYQRTVCPKYASL